MSSSLPHNAPKRSPNLGRTLENRSRVAYVVKMYPRFSETFIVSEILAHEAAGLDIEIFSLRATVDTHFQDLLSQVRAPVHYISADRPRADAFWIELGQTGTILPRFWQSLGTFAGEESRDVFQAAQLARLLVTGGFTHIHAHFASVASSVARMASRFTGLPFTFTAHAKDIFHESVQPADFRRKLEDAAAVVTVSDYNVEYLRRAYGSTASRVRRIYNGLQLSDFPWSEPRERENKVVGVGRLVEKKGFDELVRAFALLRDRGVDATCEIIGAGLLEGDIARLITDLGLAERVRLSGPLPQSEVIRRVAEAAVLAAPCVNALDGNKDGLPMVLLEAMALGTPCISTPVSGITEAVRHGETGMIVPERDATGLAMTIETLLLDADLRCRIARNARQLVDNSFDIERNTAEQRKLFGHGRLSGSEAA